MGSVMARMGSLPEKNFRTGANPALARDSFQRTAGHFPVEVKLGNTPQRQFVHLICLRLEILAVRVPFCQKLQLVGQRFSGSGSFGGLLMLFCRGCRAS